MAAGESEDPLGYGLGDGAAHEGQEEPERRQLSLLLTPCRRPPEEEDGRHGGDEEGVEGVGGVVEHSAEDVPPGALPPAGEEVDAVEDDGEGEVDEPVPLAGDAVGDRVDVRAALQQRLHAREGRLRRSGHAVHG